MTNQFVFLDDRLAGTQRLYADPVRRIVCHDPGDVDACFADMAGCTADGLHLAGYASYELGYALEPKLAPLMPARRDTPLIDFAAFDGVDTRAMNLPAPVGDTASLGLTPAWTEPAYTARFDRVMDYIHAGDVYQVNLTFPMTGTFGGDIRALYAILRDRQPVGYGGIVSLGEPAVVTLSPELFFKTDGRDIRVRPMKGTAKRGLTAADDRRIADAMRRDEKSRAENVMIVDLLRNDLGRVSEIGSVEVTDLFTVETYRTLHQMTSGIRARLDKDVRLDTLLRSLFPCGSVTGAPKIRAMEIIRDIEDGPRGAYCGAVGYIDPAGKACFNVAIRTLSVFADNRAVYNVGGAIVADSQARAEYQECLLKAKIMAATDDERTPDTSVTA